MKIKGTLKIGDSNLHIDVDTLEEVYITNISPSYTEALEAAVGELEVVVETFRKMDFLGQEQESSPPLLDPSPEEFVTEEVFGEDRQFEDDEDEDSDVGLASSQQPSPPLEDPSSKGFFFEEDEDEDSDEGDIIEEVLGGDSPLEADEDEDDEGGIVGLEPLKLRAPTVYKLQELLDIHTLEDLVQHSHSEITEVTSLGTANTISKFVKSLGYSLTRKKG